MSYTSVSLICIIFSVIFLSLTQDLANFFLKSQVVNISNLVAYGFSESYGNGTTDDTTYGWLYSSKTLFTAVGKNGK